MKYIFFQLDKMGNNHLKLHDGLALRFSRYSLPAKFQAGALAGLESKLHARYCIKFRDRTYEADGQTLGSLRGTLNSGRISVAVVTSLTVVEIVSPVTISHLPTPCPAYPRRVNTRLLFILINPAGAGMGVMIKNTKVDTHTTAN